MRIDSNTAHFFFLVNRGMFIPYVSVCTVSISAASGLVWKCSLEGQQIFSITAARIVAELRRFVAESFIGANGYRRRKGRNKDGSQFVHDCPRRDVSSRLGPSWRSGLGFRDQESVTNDIPLFPLPLATGQFKLSHPCPHCLHSSL